MLKEKRKLANQKHHQVLEKVKQGEHNIKFKDRNKRTFSLIVKKYQIKKAHSYSNKNIYFTAVVEIPNICVCPRILGAQTASNTTHVVPFIKPEKHTSLVTNEKVEKRPFFKAHTHSRPCVVRDERKGS